VTFTYRGDLSTDLDKVRFYIGDTSDTATGGTGVKPDGSNYTDEEINGVIATEGSYQAAVSSMAYTLAFAFASKSNLRVELYSESFSDIADRYQKLGDEWQEKADKQVSGLSVSNITRVDGYSDDIASDEV
jgi:hypothetical protein